MGCHSWKTRHSWKTKLTKYNGQWGLYERIKEGTFAIQILKHHRHFIGYSSDKLDWWWMRGDANPAGLSINKLVKKLIRY